MRFLEYQKTIRTPEIKLPCEDEIKVKVVNEIRKKFEKKYKVITIDGARIIFSPTSWALVRPSNTSPYLTVRIEAQTDEEVIRIKNVMVAIPRTNIKRSLKSSKWMSNG